MDSVKFQYITGRFFFLLNTYVYLHALKCICELADNLWLSLKLIQNNKYKLLAVRQDVYNLKSKMQIN